MCTILEKKKNSKDWRVEVWGLPHVINILFYCEKQNNIKYIYRLERRFMMHKSFTCLKFAQGHMENIASCWLTSYKTEDQNYLHNCKRKEILIYAMPQMRAVC